jgi:hypothetical protein
VYLNTLLLLLTIILPALLNSMQRNHFQKIEMLLFFIYQKPKYFQLGNALPNFLFFFFPTIPIGYLKILKINIIKYYYNCYIILSKFTTKKRKEKIK